MARRSTRTLLTPEQKKLQRRIKREKRKEAQIKGILAPKVISITDKSAQEQAQFWEGIKGKLRANKVLNEHKERPYWASVPDEGNNSPPFSYFYPCNMIRKGSRWYFGFLFREHRDEFWKEHDDARKELTGCVRW